MTQIPTVELSVDPRDCDSGGRVTQPAFLGLFEQARSRHLAAGSGSDPLAAKRVVPVARKTTVEFYRPALSGESLEFSMSLVQSAKTSFTLHQTARSTDSREVVAEGEFVLVCIDADGEASAVPEEITRLLGTRPSVRSGPTQHVVVNGVTTAVDVQGDGAAILFVHGFPLDRSMWRHQMATLSGWRRVAPDLRGLGLSDASDDDYSIPTYADDLVGLLNVLRIEECVLCGLSMGGYVALDVMKRHADRVRALILANTKAGADTEEAKSGRDDMISLVEREGPDAIAPKLLPKLLSSASYSTMPRVVEHLKTMISGSTPEGVIGALQAMRDREDATPVLETIDVPTLVIAGSEDQLIPLSESRGMASKIRGAQLTVIPEAGHLVPLEQPIASNRVIGEFLDSLM